jgi:hypothetical protein
VLAQGEFNRYYIRGVCRRALEAGILDVEVYRARLVAAPRPDSEALIGRRLDAEQLIADLRTHMGVDTALGLGRPNSGLSVCLP